VNTEVLDWYVMPNRHPAAVRSDHRWHQSAPGAAPADAHGPPEPAAEAQIPHGFITALLDSLQVGVATFDNDGRPVLINRMLRHLYGLGDEVSAAEAMTEGGALVIARALHGETVRDAEAVLHTADRPDRYLLTNAQPILDAGGRQLGAVSTVLDVTERSAVNVCATVNCRSHVCW
jgi:PAS domain-containing protein